MSTRTRIGDGNSFSTAYTRGYAFDGARYVSPVELANPNSMYWRNAAQENIGYLSKQITDNAEWDAFWANVPDDATSKDIASIFGAEINRRHQQRIEEIQRAAGA